MDLDLAFFDQKLGPAATGIDNLSVTPIVSSSSAMSITQPSFLNSIGPMFAPDYTAYAKGSSPDRILLLLTDALGRAVQGRGRALGARNRAKGGHTRGCDNEQVYLENLIYRSHVVICRVVKLVPWMFLK